jgi:hypothetical protein
MCVWIASLAGLRGAAWQRSCGSEGWEFGGIAALRTYGVGLGMQPRLFF